jgi:hypothetical protein
MAASFYTPISWGSQPQPDFLAGMTPTISQPGVNIPGDPSGGMGGGMFGGMSNWLNDSGILGKTLGDGTKLQGWGGMAVGAASGIMNGLLGFQQMGMAKDAAKENRRQFDMNYGAQVKTTNAQLQDRQRARVASNPGAYQSVGDYMKTYGIGG